MGATNTRLRPAVAARLLGSVLAVVFAATACTPAAFASAPAAIDTASHSRAARVGAAHARARAHEAIVGGSAAQAGAFASVVEIAYLRGASASVCTGTVVAANLVLTAAHCVVDLRTGAPERAAGFRVLSAGAAGPQITAVSGVIVGERFSRRSDDGDAALLALSTPVSAPPVALAGAESRVALPAGTTATIAGFGETRFDGHGPVQALRWAGTVVQDRRWCSRHAPPFFARDQLCTIDPPRYGTGACHGDSGGPLLLDAGGGAQPLQIGITIHGYGRCSTRLPSVFTRVEPIAAWVATWILAYNPPPTPAPAPPASAPPAPAPVQ